MWVMTVDGVASEGLRYETVGMRLRAPRVAVVFEGGADWQVWARDAMRQVTACWGGVGFVLVPHHDGEISPAVALAVQRYDPDFVVAARQVWRLREALRPGVIRASYHGEVTDELRERLVTDDFADLSGDVERAREWLAQHCSPYVRIDDGERDESDTVLPLDGSTQLLLLDSIGVTIGPCRAVPRNWGGSVATAAAGVMGVLDEPAPDATSAEDDAAVLGHLLGVNHGALPNSTVHSPTGPSLSVVAEDVPTALKFSAHGLDLTGSGRSSRSTTWVVGGSSDDFALAMIHDRTHGQGIWIDPAWGEDTSDGELGEVVRAAADRAMKDRNRGKKLVLTSASLNAAEIRQWQKVRGVEAADGVGGTVVVAEPAQRDDPLREPLCQYILQGQHDRRHTLPVVDGADGNVRLASPPPLPTVEPGHLIDTARVPVQVDLVFPGAQMPIGRGFDAHVLADGGEEERWVTWIRPARAGVSYQSQRWDLVLSGATSYGRLAAPKLRFIGLKPWIEAMAHQSGFTLQTSDPGRRADVLAQLWGGREAMAQAVASPLRAALKGFTPPRQEQDSYLKGGAVRLTSDRGVLTFDGIMSCWPEGTTPQEVREVTDDLLERGIVRRGLVMRCPACARLDFFSVDQLAQRVPCALCGAKIAFVQENWKFPVSEPQWFYDAHPAVRQLVASHSDLPLILGHYLGRSARHAWHVGEFELVEGRKSIAETDLVALVDGQLIVAEVKSNNDLAAGASLAAAVKKRITVAQVIRADQIVLATSKSTPWSTATVAALKEGIGEASWFGRPPTVRLISDLTKPAPNDTSHGGV